MTVVGNRRESTFTFRVVARLMACSFGLSRMALSALVVLGLFAGPAVAAISFVQQNYATPQSPLATVTVTLPQAQAAGNLNVVVVGKNDSTSTVTSVTDSKGNVYALAVGPTSVAGQLSQSIYYAKNIVAAGANSNTVTVRFSAPAQYVDLRVLEYAGLDTSIPLDVTAAATGTGTASTTPAVATTNANDLIFGASTVTSGNTGPGAGFTNRVITAPDGDIAEDRVVTTLGSYNATAPMTSGTWVMQMAAFRAAGGAPDTTPPTAPTGLSAGASGSTSIALAWTASTDNVGVTGYRIERCQGAGCSTFVEIANIAAVSFSDTALLPATSYSYRVRATDAAGNLSSYSATVSASTLPTGTTTPPVFVGEVHSAVDGVGAAFNSSTLSLTVSGPNSMVIVAFHAEFDGGTPDLWTVTCNGVPGTAIVDTDGYAGGAGNRRFRVYYWLNLSPGSNTIVVSNPFTGGNELAVSALLFNNVAQSSPLGAIGLDVSTAARTGESETVPTIATDLVVHVIADALFVQGVLGSGETSLSVANDGHHPADGDASLWISSKPGGPTSTTVSSSGWASRVINGAAIVLHGSQANPAPDLAVAKSHSGSFAQGQVGASYTVVVSNVGAAASSGAVTLTDNLPTGLVATALSGTGWNCNVGTLTCSRSDALAAAASFPAITLVVNVSATAPASLTNTVTVSGGGETNTANDVANDPTTITPTDTTPPTVPTGVSATATGNTSINLSWTASTDNVGVTGYRVERCQGAGCSTFAQVGTPSATTFADSGLTAGTSYSYRVRATDAAGNLSGYSSTASATTTNTDTTPPTVPTGVSATAAGNTSINLSWTASTDNVGVTGYRVERCQGAGCSTFAQVGTPAGTTFADSGLTAGTSYSYRVRATDAAGNLSGYSSTASATTTNTDTTPPTVPTGVSATAAGNTSINLSWTASTDNVGVTGYRVERCQGAGCSTFAQVGTPAATTFADSGLTAGTSYSYRVRATDAAGNLSGYSSTASATTTNTDTTPPTVPTGVSATAAGNTSINLSWTASTDNVGVTGYRVERCQGAGCSTFAQVGTPAATTFADSGLTAGTSYSYRVRATDAAGNLSGYSSTASATTTSVVGTIAFVQRNFATPQTSQSSVAVTFTSAQASGDLNVVVVGWNDSTAVVSSVTDSKGNSYTRAVGPTAVAGQLSQSIYYAKNIAAATPNANVVTVRFNVAAAFADVRILEYSGIDTGNPFDGAVAATGSNATTSTPSLATTNTTDLLFAANTVATSNSGPGTGFTNRVITVPDGDIAEDRVVNAIGSYNATAPLTRAGAWVMQMAAFKAAGSVADTTPPTVPAGLNATAVSGSSIAVGWTASTDNVAVTGYSLERCLGPGCSSFTQVATLPSVGYNDTSLLASSSYSYRVRATDAAGNFSGYSNVATATTLAPDTDPPTAPANLTATAISASQINLAWTAATDNIGVGAYRVYRCQQTGTAADCPNFVKVIQQSGPATTFNDATGLLPGTTYRYVVRALDDAGNLGPSSNEASASTTVIPSGLVAAYSFDEGVGSTVADTSGSGNGGSIGGAAWTGSGKFNSALVFNGTNAMVSIPNSASLDLTTGMTLEAWVNPSTITAAWRDVIYKGDDNYYLMASTNNGGVFAGGGIFAGTNANLYAPSQLPTNTWSHIASTYDGATLKLYLNGTLYASQAQTGAIATSGNPLQIGADSIFGQYFQGVIDEVRVYNRALAPAEIAADMNTPIGNSITPPANLVATVLSGTQVNLSWNAAFGSLGIASYRVERCTGSGCSNFALVAATPGTFFSDTTAVPNTTFRYRVQAVDGGGHLSAYSNVAETFTGIAVTPKAAALTLTRTQQFIASGPNSVGAVWSVDGVVGGGVASGTITASGVYTPPGATGVHTVTATSADQSQSATATVYITNYAGRFTHHYDNFRTGANLGETVLTPANVNSTTFGKLYTFQLDGTMHASALYMANVNVPVLGYRNIVFAATEHDSVYAFDADGVTTSPLWRTSFINPGAGITSVPALDTGECCDIANEIGITGTPVIDPATGTLYVVAKTKEVVGTTTSYVQRLHALDITTGAEKFGGPVMLQASVPGSGTGSQGGQLAFDPLRENQRPALLLSNGVVYIGFSSHGDQQPWHGWVLGYNATTLQNVLTYNPTANGYGAGIWLSGGGLNADAAGNIYFVTGNGTYDANTGGANFGNSFIKLSPAGAVLDYFTPSNQAGLNAANFDLGSSGLMLLPDQPGPHTRLALSAGKNESIHMVDRDSMGHFNAAGDTQIVQSLVNIFPNGTPEPGNYNAPVYYNGTVYFGPVNDTLMAFRMTNGLLATSPTSKSSEVYTYPGGAISVSANGNSNGILWAVQRNGSIAPGGLRAYDPGNLAVQFYNSDQAGTRDTLDIAAKYSVPLVANGKVFVGTMTQLTVYGLLP